MGKHQLYSNQQAWRDLQRFLPDRLHLTETSAPEEDFWEWRGHTVHLDRHRNADAQARVVLHHGVGTNGRQMSLILGSPLAALGYETVSVDNLGYGMTTVAEGSTPTYDDWVDLVVDFLAAENARDPKPTVLYGLSAGGMLAYHVAAAAPAGTLRGIIGMTFLDQRVQQVRDETSHDIVTSRVGVPAMALVADTPLRRMRYPMRLASRMSKLANDPGAMKVFRRDRTSAANSMSIAFLNSYMNYRPAVEPAEFDACPVLLTQPERDRWTPRHLSAPVIDSISRVTVHEEILHGAGHYPLEEPGLTELVQHTVDFVETVTRS